VAEDNRRFYGRYFEEINYSEEFADIANVFVNYWYTKLNKYNNTYILTLGIYFNPF
jgi:hypothetical protein